MSETGEQDEQVNGEFESLLRESFGEAESGSVVTGIVVSVSDRGVMVDVGLRSEGVIPRGEFSEEELGGAIQAARRLGLKTMVHANGRMSVRHAVDAGCTSIEHGFFMG